MIVIGVSGGLDLIHENTFRISPYSMHDSACALVEDGNVICAIEEERLNRIKHTNKFPIQSLRFCLETRGISLKDADLIAYYSTRELLDQRAKHYYLFDPKAPVLHNSISYFQRLIGREFNYGLSVDKFHFVHHHYAHAMSAFALSGYESSLIVTLDGAGESVSGTVMMGKGRRIEQIASIPDSKSLGGFYDQVIKHLGYYPFNEYKIMGLAPYGNPEIYRHFFRTLYTLLPNGDYVIHNSRMFSLYDLERPRRAWEPFNQKHQDIAASLQEALEEIVIHVIRHYQHETRQKNLCLAGGVAHNCTLNGKILSSGMFENVFVQPAAHDAGCALGAAFSAYYSLNPEAWKPQAIGHVYWGTDIGNNQSILEQLIRWNNFITYKDRVDIIDKAADLLARGEVIGWAQGRSEFGPRALGNRSILADPRPAENKDRINLMVKKREAYRPFAPAVLEEHADEYFEIPLNRKQLPFMTFVVNVKENRRDLLGAVTHVNGTARIQTVSRKTSERLWDLIHAFKARTGIPILLNTSFNNNIEPIVDSVEDIIVCFLTTKLDHLFIENYLIEKKAISWQAYLSLKPLLPPYISIHQIKNNGPDLRNTVSYSIRNSYDMRFEHTIQAEVFRVLMLADGEKKLGDILAKVFNGIEDQCQKIIQGCLDLWSQRLIQLRP